MPQPAAPCFQACSYVPRPATPRAQVAWNEVALTQGNLITGYPHGPTNLPMYGKLLREHNCGKLCRHQWLNATRGMYWCGPCSAAPSAPVPHAHTPAARTQASLAALGLCSGLVTSCQTPGTNMRTTATAGADLRAARWVPRLSARQLTYHLMHPGRLGLVLLPGYSKRRDGALETENNINCETLLFCFEIS